MTLVQPVINEDPFAGVSWEVVIANLALEKILVGDSISVNERDKLDATLNFVNSLSRSETHLDAISLRNAKFLADFRNDTALLPRLAEDLGKIVNKLDSATGLIEADEELILRAQEWLLSVLETLNYCRAQR